MTRPPMETIRAALIGYGLGGRSFHAPFIASTPGLRLSAIVTGDAERGRMAAAEHPGSEVVAQAAQLFERSGDIDLVVVSTPNRTHAPLALAAIDAGLAVVVDKPIAPTSQEARQLVDAAQRRGTLLTVYQNRRWDGDFLTVRRLIAAGQLGDVYRFESRFERWRPTPKGGWRELAAPEEAGGLLFDLGSHLIDQALVLLGPITNLYAEVCRRRPGAAVDDDVFLALTHVSGVHSHLWATVVAAQNGPRFRVLGSRAGYTKWGTDVQEAALRDGARPGGPDWGVEPRDQWGVLGAGDAAAPVATERGNYGAFYDGVVRALRDGAPPPVDPADAVAVLEIIEAARSSVGGRAYSEQ